MKILALEEAMQKSNRLPSIQANANMDIRDLFAIYALKGMEKLIQINAENAPVLNI